jgi:putative NADPH-quinone reductase
MTATHTPTTPAPRGADAGARRILVVVGHPIRDTLNHALAHAYTDAAHTNGAEVRVHDLAGERIPSTENTDQLRVRHGDTAHLAPIVRRYIDDLRWAQHVVVLFPQWWGTYPAVLKEYLDRVVLSGVTFRNRRGLLPLRMLTGRTARILMTADGPGWWNRMRYRNAAETSLARATFEYCGVRMAGVTRFMKVRFSTPERRAGWLVRAAALGARDARGRTAVRARTTAGCGATSRTASRSRRQLRHPLMGCGIRSLARAG